jgi:hypothetical protein
MKPRFPGPTITSVVLQSGLLVTILLTLPYCGSLKLSGDPPSAVCGNGQRETGEECDGEAEPCDTQGCGGGTRQCLPECTWGECREEVFRVLAGPLMTSSGIIVGVDNHLLWTGIGFNIISTGKYDPEATDDELFLSRLTPGGELEEGPSLITPPTRPNDYFFLLATMMTGDFPMAIMFDCHPSPPRTVFNTFDLNGMPRWEQGVLIFGDDIFPTAMDMASSREGILGIIVNRVQKSFVFIDADGNIMSESRLECGETENAEGGRVVSDESGFLVLIDCLEWEEPTYLHHLRLQMFDANGISILGPLEIPVDIYMADFWAAAAHDEGEVGVVFMSWPWDDGEENADLMFFVAGDDGSLVLPPRRIGQARILTDVNNTVDMTWSGSEYGIAWVESVSDPEDPGAEKHRINVLRVSNDGSDVAQAFEVSSDFLSHTLDIEWSGSAYGLSWLEPPYRNPETQVNSWFVIVGCGPPQN